MNSTIFRKKIAITIPVPSVSSLCHSCLCLPVLWCKTDRGGWMLSLAAQNWLKSWACIPHGRRLLRYVLTESQMYFFNYFGEKSLLPKQKSLAIIQEIIFCRHCACLYHQKFCLCKTISIQAFSLTTWWGERGQTGVQKEQRWVSKELCDVQKHNFC